MNGQGEALKESASRRLGSRLIPRARLVSKLMGEDGRPVTLIDAPAGFGKSTVLWEWERADPRPFALLTLGNRHDDQSQCAIGADPAVAHDLEPPFARNAAAEPVSSIG